MRVDNDHNTKSGVHRLYADLWLSGESKGAGMGPLIRPPRAMGVLPVQNMQT